MIYLAGVTMLIAVILLTSLITWQIVSDMYWKKGYRDCQNSDPTVTYTFETKE